MKEVLRNLLLVFILFSSCTLYGQDSRLSISPGGIIATAENRFGGSQFEIAQNIPNPFVSFTDIGFFTLTQGFVEFKVVNLIGKEMIRLVLETDPGRNNIRFDGSDFMPGVYVYSISNGSQTLTRRMIISKK
jgi:Secretion system C-terminal sorting domain